MLARIRKSMEEKDQGFTLIELLVVMIIIGILAAIAIPVFLNQRKKAVESSMKSDLRTVANELETYFTDNQAYIASTQASAGANVVLGTGGTAINIPVSKGNTIAATITGTGVATGTFCITVTNAQVGTTAADTISYDSDKGGVLAKGTACS